MRYVIDDGHGPTTILETSCSGCPYLTWSRGRPPEPASTTHFRCAHEAFETERDISSVHDAGFAPPSTPSWCPFDVAGELVEIRNRGLRIRKDL